MSCMVYEIALLPMTLSDVEGHFSFWIQRHAKCIILRSCLLCDAEHELFVIAKFLVCIYIDFFIHFTVFIVFSSFIIVLYNFHVCIPFLASIF